MSDFLKLQDIVVGSARGRKGTPLKAQVVRELNESDLAIAANPPNYEVAANPIVKLRHTHHLLARLLAEGRPPGECGLITGYSSSRISILQNDPAFKELVEYYKGQAQEAFLNVHERIAALGLASLDELQERLENEPDKFSEPLLLKMATDLLDRTVTKPTATTPPPSGGLNLQVTFVQSPNADSALTPKAGAPQGAVIDGTLAKEQSDD